MKWMILSSIKKILKRTGLLFCRGVAKANGLLLIKYELFIKNNDLYFLFLCICHLE